MTSFYHYLPCAALLALVYCPSTLLADDNGSGYTDLPLESLLDIKVTSVSKKSQLLTEAAAAVFVITQEDIRRSGVTSIADALRMAPGVQVARIDSNKWAVSSRGHNGRFANKLLVLQDGRSLYTPLFSGVYWEVQDTVMEDIDRIEVIRGPGAALWGANAVNGVINIITKPAGNTSGVLLSTGGGTYESGFATVRYGLELGDDSDLRMFVKHQQKGTGVYPDGTDAYDSWSMTRGGFRLDSKLSVNDKITLQGDYYSGKLRETTTIYNPFPPFVSPYSKEVKSDSDVSGGNILTRWQKNLAENDSLSLQMYYDHNETGMFVLPQKFDTFDLEFQNRFSLMGRHDLVWGAGYRFNLYQITNTPTLSFAHQRESSNLFSFFLHDEIKIIPEKLSFIIGSRFEHNDYSGFEIQPNARLIWTPTHAHTLWGAVSRAVRTATRGEMDIQYRFRTLPPGSPGNAGSLPLRMEILGSEDFKSEDLLAYEIGYRVEPLHRLTFDIAAYYNVYDKLRVTREGAQYLEPSSVAPTNQVTPLFLSNDMYGNSYGVSISIDWLPADWWRIQTAYSFQRLAMYLNSKSNDQVNRGNAEGDTPRHQFSLRSGFDIGKQVMLDLWLRGADSLKSIDARSIPGYITMDARLAWKPLKNLEVALVGQNLFFDRHQEFIPEYVNTVPSEIPRSFYGKLTWKY